MNEETHLEDDDFDYWPLSRVLTIWWLSIGGLLMLALLVMEVF